MTADSQELSPAPAGTVLIVDDERRNRKLLRDLLVFHGYAVGEAENGEQALQMIAAALPDVVLLDVMMPGLNGFEVCRQIKANPATGQLPVLLVTALNERSDRLRGIQAGADDFLSKPIDLEEINLRVRNAVTTRRLRQELAREEGLRSSEARFRSLIENSSDMLFLLDPDYTIRYASSSVRRTTGFLPEDLISLSYFDLVHPDDLEDLQKVFRRVMKKTGNLSDDKVARLRHVDGSWHYHEGTCANLLEDPNVKALVVNSRDVTVRQQREIELQVIATLSQALRSVGSRAEMFPIVIDQTVNLLHVNSANLQIMEPNTGDSITVAVHGKWTPKLGERIPPGHGLDSYFLESNQPYLNNDFQNEPRLLDLSPIGNTRAAAGVPLIAQEKIIGSLWIGRSPHITESEVGLLAAIADISANAIFRATLHEQTQQHLEQIIALRAIDNAIASSLDVRFTFSILLVHALEQLKADAADIFLFNPHLQSLEFCSSRGFHNTRGNQYARFKIGDSQAGRAVREHCLVFVPNLVEVEGFSQNPSRLAGEGFVSYHALPLSAKGEVNGVMEVYHRAAFNHDADWLSLFETIAGQAGIAIDISSLFEGLQHSNTELFMAYDATIEGWSRALDLRDKETEGHTLRVTEMTEKLASAMGVSREELVHIRRGSLLHDIGKMGVPDYVLLKPGELSPEEWDSMRRHPQHAYDMLSPITYLQQALDIPYCHHEKWDGSGYPRQMAGEQIPLAARIFSVVDVWDAVTSDRPYRSAWSKESAIEHIRAGAGTYFDPRVVDAFLDLINQELW
jgi:PAS domain S-box-containing protein/putative nucleotidyltransferase with HDIG domain